MQAKSYQSRMIGENASRRNAVDMCSTAYLSRLAMTEAVKWSQPYASWNSASDRSRSLVFTMPSG